MYWNTMHSHPISAILFILFPLIYVELSYKKSTNRLFTYTFNDEYSGCSFSISINSIVTDFILDIAPLTLATKIL